MLLFSISTHVGFLMPNPVYSILIVYGYHNLDWWVNDGLIWRFN